ncbi:MAG: alpha-amylase, partial [Anaerolineae bacterium]|nr:alpha-amylase [Anaerolineae bacterium]
RLYDWLRDDTARAVLTHLHAGTDYQQHMLRFIENHDEARAATAFGPGRDLAAAVLIATLPGASLIHEGQMAGHKIRLPVQLGRRPLEPADRAVEDFYRLLLAEAKQSVYHGGTWNLRECMPAWDLNASNRNLIAYTWRAGEGDATERRLIVVNYSAHGSQGQVPMRNFGLAGREWHLHDLLHPGDSYRRTGAAMVDPGLYIDLHPWQAHIFRFE